METPPRGEQPWLDGLRDAGAVSLRLTDHIMWAIGGITVTSMWQLTDQDGIDTPGDSERLCRVCGYSAGGPVGRWNCSTIAR